MPTYRYDKDTKQMVKISDRVFRTNWQEEDMPFAQRIMDGYRKCEERGQRYYGKAANIKKIWGVT